MALSIQLSKEDADEIGEGAGVVHSIGAIVLNVLAAYYLPGGPIVKIIAATLSSSAIVFSRYVRYKTEKHGFILNLANFIVQAVAMFLYSLGGLGYPFI